MNDAFAALLREIPQIGIDWHAERLLEHSLANAPRAFDSIRDVPPAETDVLIISAGPSLHRNRILERVEAMRPTPLIVAIDGSYVQCLRAGIHPRYVVTLDPHPTRIVRWFGDPNLAANSAGDDYFARQDLDEAFRADAERVNAENILLLDEHADMTSLIMSCTTPPNVEERTRGRWYRYWFAPLVDHPDAAGSLTRRMAEITGLPSLNTGGTVGTAAVMFAHRVLKARRIAVVGMDLGYAADTPLERTQSWNMLKDRKDVADLYPCVVHPQWGACFTDPTYWHYRNGLLSLLKSADRTLYNCTEGGTLFGPRVRCMRLEEWADGKD